MRVAVGLGVRVDVAVGDAVGIGVRVAVAVVDVAVGSALRDGAVCDGVAVGVRVRVRVSVAVAGALVGRTTVRGSVTGIKGQRQAESKNKTRQIHRDRTRFRCIGKPLFLDGDCQKEARAWLHTPRTPAHTGVKRAVGWLSRPSPPPQGPGSRL
jgi:hypothetical protein